MTNREVVERLAKDKVVEQLIYKNDISTERVENLEELSQDIYLMLLMSDIDIVSIYEKGEMNYFLMKIIRNNLFSKTSRYYYNYKKNWDRLENIDEE